MEQNEDRRNAQNRMRDEEIGEEPQLPLLAERAKRAKPGNLKRLLEKVPDVEAEERDRI